MSRRSPRFGAHMSVAGGLPLAVDRAVVHGCRVLQIFAKNGNQWRGRDVPAEEVAEFRRRVSKARISTVVSHASYLINLASSTAALREQSIGAMRDELARATALGLHGVVLHPGCYTSGSKEAGLRLIADALLEVIGSVRIQPDRDPGSVRLQADLPLILLEHTAGQGTSLGSTFEDLATIIEHMHGHARVGVCLDTCHLFASGYDIASPEGYAHTFRRFERTIGLPRLKVFHMNDSRKPLGSRVDRHTHIGEGCIGSEAFRRIVNDRRFRHLPMLLETPKEESRSRAAVGVDRWDEKNLNALRELVDPQ